MQRPSLFLYLLLTLLLAQEIRAQDIIYFMDKSKVETKVLEVGIDSIRHLPSAKKSQLPTSVPRAFVRYIEYRNGQKYFIAQSKLYLVSGKIVLAHVLKLTDKLVQYQDVFTHKVKNIPVRKVASIHYHNDEKVNILDKINLWSGQFMAGQVLEVNEEVVTFENITDKKRKQAVDIAKIRSIEFKNGFEQEFSSPQPNK
ncbi:MAG: hypothetical protein RIG62_30415 [Cyclobacteriaceae bacterium]